MKDTNMNITIDFFSKDLIQAIGAGIYEISVHKNGETRILYIGESVHVLVRCATHLYKLHKDPGYFGFTEEGTIKDSSVKLTFKLLEKVNNRGIRRKREKELIKEKVPLTQSGIGDYQKNKKDRVAALRNFLEF